MDATNDITPEQAIEAFGNDIVNAYIHHNFRPGIVALGFYTVENAPTWMNVRKFMIFAAQHIQETKSMYSESQSTPASPSKATHGPETLTATPITPARPLLSKSKPKPKPNFIELSDDDTFPPSSSAMPPSSPLIKMEKRKRKESNLSDSDIEVVSESPKPLASQTKRKPNKRPKKSRQVDTISISGSDSEADTGTPIRITRQLVVAKLITLTTIPSTWTIYNGAYLLDLSADTRQWKDSAGDLLSMAAIIKSQDRDSWGGGSAGHTQPAKCPSVHALDGVKCQLSEHKCQGIYHCSELDMSLVDQCHRYAPDDDEMRDLFDAEREINIQETSSIENRVAAFYKEAMKEPCYATLDNGNKCEGYAVYRKYGKKTLSHYGKTGFIGCSDWVRGKLSERKHRFMGIPTDVNEKLVEEIFTLNGSFRSQINTNKCARVVHPRSGIKGYAECAYTHIKNGKVVQGTLIHRKCPAKIKIYSPLDRTNHRAIVILSNYHNHPQFPATKLSREGQDKYEAAVKMMGVSKSTVLKLDNGQIHLANSTKAIFEGRSLVSVDPALANARNKRKVIQKMRSKVNQHGTGLEGVIHKQGDDDKNCPQEKRYIQEVSTHDGINLIVTMLPSLAARIHQADATLHDNTYKRVHGEWKEWEVVIWDKRMNMRITVARLYCNKETRKAFEQMWTTFWRTVERVTKQPLKMKFIDGCGLRAILVDGCKPQVDACGDALVRLVAERPTALIKEADPQVIVQHIVRTCVIHLERKLDNLAKTLPQDVMDRVRGFPFLKTRKEVTEFEEFCEQSEHKCLRDWIIDKKGSPWFIPSVNQFMSKISEEDWYLTPGDTNLNESAHPFTNAFTGTNLSLMEAINEARIMDSDIAEKLQLCEENCVLINHRNTKPERDHHNRKRQENRAKAIAEHRKSMSPLKSNARGKSIVPFGAEIDDSEQVHPHHEHPELIPELSGPNEQDQLSPPGPPFLSTPVPEVSQAVDRVVTSDATMADSSSLLSQINPILLSNLATIASEPYTPSLQDLLVQFPISTPSPAIEAAPVPQAGPSHASQAIASWASSRPVAPKPAPFPVHRAQGTTHFDPHSIDLRDINLLKSLRRAQLNEVCFLHNVSANGKLKSSVLIEELQKLVDAST
ncbi:hypothetical protein CVT24_004653 [Panaeolus cyanescens]|uniref:Uncharacterized protein n=1 Tax=Panaeolus cyanescens TaxID=181874 RepID=A0A409YSF9_9AGAR|nr:hypothetical protein CVT24_004653 [Panaeolus cyanescens]